MSLIIKGDKTINEGGFLDKLCKVMVNDEFRTFFHKYLHMKFLRLFLKKI